MSKMKQIAALTAMLVGVIMYASPAKSAVCFLPDDDGSCGGGDIEISDDSTSENQCADFTLSQNQRNSREYDSDCYTCKPCTYNGRTTYKCALNSGATWYGGNLSVCCTGGTTYDSAEGKCCPAGGCAHNCPEGQSWDSSTKSCKCDNGKDANGGICCADSEHVSDGICCPEKKHNDGGVCKCDSQYNTDDDGNCIPQNNIKTTITVQYSLDMSRQNSSSWLNLTFKVLSASDAKSHHVELTFNPMDGAEPRNCTISYPLTFGTNTKTKVQCGSIYSMMNTPELTNISVDNSNVAASIRLDQLDNSTVQNDKYVIKFVKRKSCADLGYVSDYCSSEQYAHYTGVTDSHNDKCYTCEPYDSKKTCKEIGLQFGKNLVGEETGCAGSGIEGKVFTYEWAYDEAGEAIQGSDGDCIICKPTSEVNIYTSNSKCYKITSITGDNVVKIAERHYSVPLESNFTINAEKDLTSSKWNTGYCKSIYPYIEIDNMSSAYEKTKQYSYKESKTFTLNDDFLKEYKIVENEMSVSPVEEPVTYTAELYLENDDCPYVEGICPSAGIVVSDASDDEYMKDVSVDVVMSINCCGYKDGCGNPFPNIIFDGEAWWNHHYTSAESYCSYTFGTSEFRIYKRSEGKYIATIKGFGCAKINDGAIEICIQEH